MSDLTLAMRECVFDLAMAGRTQEAIRNITGLRSELVLAFWTEFRASKERARAADRAFKKRVLRLERQGFNQKQIAHRLTAPERQVQAVLLAELDASA